VALAVMVVALPTAVYLYGFADRALKTALAERRQKTATALANGALTDYFRQFSQSAYDGHYDTDALSRPKSFYAAGYSTVTFTADSTAHTLRIEARGVYGTESEPKTTRVLEALIKFYSDLVRFGTMVNGPFTVSASNVTYLGGFYTNGNLSVTGSNVTFSGGPVIVAGNMSGAASVRVEGDLYYSGTSAGSVTVTGKKYNYIPSVDWPTLDFNYYAAQYTYTTTASQTIVFNSTQTFTVVGGATYAIPPQGAIIYANGANLTVRGIVSGPVTIVAGASTAGSCSSSTGKITVSDNLYYAGASSITASASGSFAALASNCVTFSKTGSDLVAAGVYFVQNGTSNMQANGSSGRRLLIYGVRTQSISISGFSGLVVTYDSSLKNHQPPGLPEKALLANWNLHH
jgi:hypothetical protein